ncbi:hypothetical protein HPB50_010045 [Hyalomma asiaticum]|uniref:Uncharacterized protein n=1 Tax=Hyalomma asiaticum TaxID=266040 RepID=A0ACB7S1P8_HYAAI|nr:hypothetical protein HPB50_010045 [Hyalomma asiaticum]
MGASLACNTARFGGVHWRAHLRQFHRTTRKTRGMGVERTTVRQTDAARKTAIVLKDTAKATWTARKRGLVRVHVVVVLCGTVAVLELGVGGGNVECACTRYKDKSGNSSDDVEQHVEGRIPRHNSLAARRALRQTKTRKEQTRSREELHGEPW